jgi:2-phosphosulfolactate phosphatase
MPFSSQSDFDLRCDWGPNGLQNLADSDAIVIIDVLSFTTCVDVAVARRAIVLPYRWKDNSAAQYARDKNAHLAGSRRDPRSKYSLSPTSLIHIPPATRLVLPSPNGSALAFAAKSTGATVFAASLRNAAAVAAAAARTGRRISVIPAGERWPDQTARFAIEDLIGAGAVLSALPGRPSPEAELVITAFNRFKSDLRKNIASSTSGRELIELGFPKDVEIACELNASTAVPVLKEDKFVNSHTKPA